MNNIVNDMLKVASLVSPETMQTIKSSLGNAALAAIPSAALMLGGSAIGKAYDSAAGMLGETLAFRRMRKHLEGLPDEQRRWVIGDRDPNQLRGRFSALYRMAPDLMGHADSAAGMVAHTLLQHGGEHVLPPDVARQFVELQSSIDRRQKGPNQFVQSIHAIADPLTRTFADEIAAVNRRGIEEDRHQQKMDMMGTQHDHKMDESRVRHQQSMDMMGTQHDHKMDESQVRHQESMDAAAARHQQSEQNAQQRFDQQQRSQERRHQENLQAQDARSRQQLKANRALADVNNAAQDRRLMLQEQARMLQAAYAQPGGDLYDMLEGALGVTGYGGLDDRIQNIFAHIPPTP